MNEYQVGKLYIMLTANDNWNHCQQIESFIETEELLLIKRVIHPDIRFYI